MARLVLYVSAAVVAALALATAATAHPERPSFFPNYPGKVPQYRTSGPSRVVCTDATRRLIAGSSSSGGGSGSASTRQSGTRNRAGIIQQNGGGRVDPVRERNERLLGRCRYHTIQAAVNAAHNGDRILIMPGTYTEEPSRRVPTPDPRCANDFTASERDPSRALPLGTGLATTTPATEKAPTYAHHRKCPNSQNLIAIVGDRTDDGDRRCDDKCNLQIEGTGRRPSDVRIIGARNKNNAILADRADGIYLTNFRIQYSDFNNIYVHETNGFHMNRIVTRWSREYGALSFTSDHGLYENMDAYGVGDGAVYPGSGPQRRRCGAYGIEIRNINAHDSNMGYSGTAGDSIWVHHSRFHHNATGQVTDSFAAGHPGEPQDCARFENNKYYSNNANFFNEKRDEYCRNTPPEKRDLRIVCPSFQVPVGTGLLIAGGNGNVIKRNYFYDNWRNGARLLYVPAAARGETDPAKQYDTSNGNRFLENRMGVRPDGTRDPNGRNPKGGDGYADFWWDEEGRGNCWKGNVGPGGRRATTNGFPLRCPSATLFTPRGNPIKIRSQAPCALWDPTTPATDDPPGCNWFTRPPEPR